MNLFNLGRDYHHLLMVIHLPYYLGYDLSYLWKGLTLSCDSYLFPGGVPS